MKSAAMNFTPVCHYASLRMSRSDGDLYGQAVDSASQVADATTKAARKTAGSFEKALRNTIENQPYTAVVIALGLGWLFGRMHRPF
jgi:hypothetical protein